MALPERQEARGAAGSTASQAHCAHGFWEAQRVFRVSGRVFREACSMIWEGCRVF